MRRTSTRSLVGATAALLLILAAAAAAPAVTAKVSSSAASHPCLVMTGSGDPAFVKNFNPFLGGGLPSNSIAQGTFYEPLIVTSAGGVHTVPWLARSWKWSNGNKTLTMQIAPNAKWSDGKPLTVGDVVYSLTAGRQDKTMDRIGLVGAGNNIASIKAKGAHAVVIKLKTADSQFIPAILNRAFVVPKHIWSKVKDVATFTNSKPVGSGPFTVIKRFTTQDYVLGKNPHYWQAGLPKIGCLEYQQASSNDAALALIQSGKVDWTHNFVPNVEKAYEAKDPAHYHAFYSNRDYPISLVFDDTVYPYSLVAFRKAVSLAIDRNSVWKLGEYGYETPADGIGLSGLFPDWVTDKSVKALAKQMTRYDPAAAKKTLTDAGFTYKGNNVYDPKGNAVKLDIHVISGWSDWVASNQIITKNLQAIGIDSNVKLEASWGDWFPNAYATKNPTLLWQVGSRGSPYAYFYSNLSQNAFIPSGQDASPTGNWEHFSDAKATTVLNQWKTTLDVKKQKQAATQLEKIFLQQLPIIPVMIGARWSTYSTKYFHCFPTEKNFYADPIFTTNPDAILLFTTICPGGKSGR
ncbi:MAG TPA: ABC transporter substrate-binding protein [Gaiellaceae bacterium]|nr:ABC transporter substrate-binding protein [Gaiellaceae bacterium]